MAALADVVCSYRTYPHVDMRETGRRAAELLERMMAGLIRPRIVLARRPMLWGANTGRTDEGPMIDILARAARFEAKPEVHCVSVNAGFPLSDVYDAGPTVLVAGEGGDENLRAMAEALADDLWSTRDVITNTFYSPKEAAVIAATHDGGGRPLVIADFADNPGAGAYGDATNLLKAMLDAGLENAAFACIRDEEAARQLIAAGVGATVTLDLGGKVDPTFGGPPLTLTGEVRNVTDGTFVCDGPMWQGVEKHLGPTAVFRVGGTDVIVASNLVQVTDLQTFLSQGIDPRRRRTLAVKSMQHFRAAFEPIASRVIVADSGGLASPNIGRLPFRKVRRPIHPLDPDAPRP
jgi:microcystin degradation protein MlrC